MLNIEKLEKNLKIKNLLLATQFIIFNKSIFFKDHKNKFSWWAGLTLNLGIKSDKHEKICCYYLNPKWQEYLSFKRQIKFIFTNDKKQEIAFFNLKKNRFNKSINLEKSANLQDLNFQTKEINSSDFDNLKEISKNSFSPISDLYINPKLLLINEIIFPIKSNFFWNEKFKYVKLDELQDESNSNILLKDNLFKKIIRQEENYPVPDYKNRIRVESHIAKNERDDLGLGFMERGQLKFQYIYSIYKRFGYRNLQNSNVLDWGCGCGSIARYMISGCKNFFGIDIDPVNIDWCKKNLDKDANFDLVHFFDRLDFLEDNSLDLIYAFSVMTHLIPPHQDHWIGCLAKKCRGIILLSIHGQGYHQSKYILSEDLIVDEVTQLSIESETRSFKANYDIRDVNSQGFYTDVSNSYKDIIKRWSKYVDVLSIQNFGHDWVICRPK
mgnify:FL=1